VPSQLTGVKNPGNTQRPPESAASLCQREASRIRMQARTPTRQAAGRIGA